MDDQTNTPTNGQALAQSTIKTTAIALAIRDEIRKLLAEEVLDLDRLQAIHCVARDGRALLAIRNPLNRFDARAQGLGHGPGSMSCSPGYGGFGQWNGPAVFGAKEATERQIRVALAESPLAKAVRTELLELVAPDVFGPTELLQIEQMADQARRVLVSALGLDGEVETSNRPRPHGAIGNNSPYAAWPNPFMNPMEPCEELTTPGTPGLENSATAPMAPSSSQETYGAKISRELNASLGKLTDMMARLNERLGDIPPLPEPEAQVDAGLSFATSRRE